MISDIDILVDREKCIACGQCVNTCIMDNLRLSVAPCRQACPLGMNCQGYIKLIEQKKYKEAKDEIREYLPFASILGRVCHAPCEDACLRKEIDGAVQIRALKRFLADCFVNELDMPHAVTPETGKQVSVIGSGPAGLMAAWQIRKNGHHVTVYESDEKPGGLLRYGIPESRLPKKELNKLIRLIEACGIKFELSTKIGIDIAYEQLSEQNDAIIIAVGGGQSALLDFPGTEHCLDGLTVLRQSNSGEKVFAGKHIAVIGGGNTAIDVSLTYKRMGVENVDVMVRRTLKDLRAYQRSIGEAVEEGVSFKENSVPASITQLDDGRYELKLNRSILQFDSHNNRVYTIDQNQYQTVVVDQVVLAIGQSMASHTLPGVLFDGQSGSLTVAPKTLQAAFDKKVFACGDVVNASNSVVHALASGAKAAESLNLYLTGESLTWGRDQWAVQGWEKGYEAGPNCAKGVERCSLESILPDQRSNSDEIEITLSQDKAIQEARRCLSCGRAYDLNKTCWYCLPCEIECSQQALEVRIPYLVR